jgi:hypothetical protein
MWMLIAGGLIALAEIALLLAWALLDQLVDRALAGEPPVAWPRVWVVRVSEVAWLLLGVVGLLALALAACVAASGGL